MRTESEEQRVERLCRECRGLVYWAAGKRHRRGQGPELEDLVGAGLLGLVKAARAWDPTRAGKFSTLAVVVIEREIERCQRRWDRGPETRSIEALLTTDDGDLLDGSLADLAPGTEERALLALDCERALAAVERLPERQRQAVRETLLRERSSGEVARELGVTRQRILNARGLGLESLRRSLRGVVVP